VECNHHQEHTCGLKVPHHPTNITQKFKGYGSQKLLAEFSIKNWIKGGLDTLLQKLKETGSSDRKCGFSRPSLMP